MDAHVIDDLYRELADTTGIATPTREPLRVWTLSGVERLHLADASTVIFKFEVGQLGLARRQAVEGRARSI